MTRRNWKHSAAQVSDKTEGPFPLRLVRLILMELQDAVDSLQSTVTTVIGGGGGATPSPANGIVAQVRWQANGPYIVDTSVDGAWIATRSMTISSVYLYRTTPGSSGSTVLDLHKNGVTMYTTQANRPTIGFGGMIVKAVNPDVISWPVLRGPAASQSRIRSCASW